MAIKHVGALVVWLGVWPCAARAQPLTWGLADGNANWPAGMKDTITQSMNEAVAAYNEYGTFAKHDTANYNSGVPTAQSNYDGWIDFGHLYNARTAIHEIAHTLGVGTYWAFDNGTWKVDSTAGRLEQLYDGQDAVLSTGGTHFWPYGLNYDNEDGPAVRERHCKLVAALRFDMGIVQDSDHDGMPDDWETLHFQGLDQTGAGDVDADGITNVDEYNSDSDPNVACALRDGHTYLVRTQISERLLTLASTDVRDGTKLTLRSAAQPGQRWTAHYVGAGFWRLSSADSDEVLALPGNDSTSAIPLQLAKWDSSLRQQWRVVSGPGAASDHWLLANRQTGRAADCLDGAEGAAVEQYPFLGNLPQQFWKFEDVGDPGDGGVGAGLDASVMVDAGATAAGDAGAARADADAHAAVRADGSAPLPRDGGTAAPDDGDAPMHEASSGCALTRSSSASASMSSMSLLLAACLLRRRARRRR